LDRVVRQVNELIINVMEVDPELSAARSQVPFREEKYVHLLREANPHSDVELALVDEEWALYVLLDYKSVKLHRVKRLLRGLFRWRRRRIFSLRLRSVLIRGRFVLALQALLLDDLDWCLFCSIVMPTFLGSFIGGLLAFTRTVLLD
jgi:hypothetical protein